MMQSGELERVLMKSSFSSSALVSWIIRIKTIKKRKNISSATAWNKPGAADLAVQAINVN